jgi:hypothetical protein
MTDLPTIKSDFFLCYNSKLLMHYAVEQRRMKWPQKIERSNNWRVP